MKQRVVLYVGKLLKKYLGCFKQSLTPSPFSPSYRGQEFVHQHSLDKSWHILLAPGDAREVIIKGWGERGPPHVALGNGG